MKTSLAAILLFTAIIIALWNLNGELLSYMGLTITILFTVINRGLS